MDSRASPPVEELLAHTGFVRSLARGALGRDDGSEDLVQDALLAALRNGPAEPRAARDWFFRVVTNRAASLHRREAARRRHLRQVRPAPPVPSPAKILEREEARRRLVRALLGLDPRYRDPLVLRYYEDLPPRKIARRLELPVETVRTRLRRGLSRLRDALDARYPSRRAWIVAVAPLLRLPRGGEGVLPGAGHAASATLVSKPVLAGAVAAGVLALALTTVGGRGDEKRFAASGAGAAPSLAAAPVVLRGAPHAQGAQPAEAARPGVLATDGGRRRTLTVRVLDDAGLPVPGAEVRVAEQRHDFPFDREVVRGPTDESGRFQLPRTASPPPGAHVPAASFRLEIAPPAEREDLQARALDGWRPGDVTVALPRGFALSGEVVDRVGRAVPGAWVRLETPGRQVRIPTDPRGQFRAFGLAAGRWAVRVELARARRGATDDVWMLDSGSRGVRLEVTAGLGMPVAISGFDARNPSHRRLALRVTEHDPSSGANEGVSHHAVSPDGTVWLYGLDEQRRYTLWWGPDEHGSYAYAASRRVLDEPAPMALLEGRGIRLEVVRPAGWTGWPTVRATAPGIEVYGTWTPQGDCVIAGLPDREFVVQAEGRDALGCVVSGVLRVRAGSQAQLVLSRR